MSYNKKTFCNGPWTHIQMDARGKYTPCRLIDRAIYDAMDPDLTIQNVSIMEYFNSKPLRDVRKQILSGDPTLGCEFCYYQESFGQSSMRKRYLERIGLDNDDTFDIDIQSSDQFEDFEYSRNNDGLTKTYPVDLQIDLTNVCNSSCIMCSPNTSKNASAHRKLFMINPDRFHNVPKRSAWSDDPVILDRFIDEICNIPNLWYIHFIGGETLYCRAFYTILRALVDRGVSKNIMLGFLTNGTIFNKELKDLLPQFKSIHLGVSIETPARVNEYIRYPVTQDALFRNIDEFKQMRDESGNIFLEFSVTPTILSILHLPEMIRFSRLHHISMTCNVLRNRSDLMIELLPDDLIEMTLQKFLSLSVELGLERCYVVHDTCNPDNFEKIVSNICFNYIDLLQNIKRPDDVDYQRSRLIQYLEGMEIIHKNKILEYLPEYEKFLRGCGYRG